MNSHLQCLPTEVNVCVRTSQTPFSHFLTVHAVIIVTVRIVEIERNLCIYSNDGVRRKEGRMLPCCAVENHCYSKLMSDAWLKGLQFSIYLR